MQLDWNDIAERVLWTAAQAFLGAFGGIETFSSLEALQSAGIAGATAAAAAVVALAKNIVRQKRQVNVSG